MASEDPERLPRRAVHEPHEADVPPVGDGHLLIAMAAVTAATVPMLLLGDRQRAILRTTLFTQAQLKGAPGRYRPGRPRRTTVPWAGRAL